MGNNAHQKEQDKIGSVLVIGGGVGGIQSSLDLAESGFKVYLVEKSPTIGGVMSQLDKTFPTNDCSMCILSPKLVECSRHLNIDILTCSEVEKVTGEAGNFKVKVKQAPRYVDLEKCNGCGLCSEACTVRLPDMFNKGLSERKAIYIDYPQAVPLVYAIDKRGIPPCRATCPAGMNVQGYIALIREGKYKEAVQLMRQDMPFPAVCGRVCFHPCEAECERGKVDDPIAIRDLKRFASKYELENGVDLPEVSEKRDEKVAIVGAGPSGLTAAYELAQKGFKVTVYESLPKPGGMLRYAIPAYRLPKDVLEKEIQFIEDLGVEIKTNMALGKDITLEGLKKDYNSVLIAIGTQKNRSMELPGEETPGVIQALSFLNDVNSKREARLSGTVAVVGGGNVAIDAARCACRMGAEKVNLLYRRSREEMPAYHYDVVKAEEEGVDFHLLINPVGFHAKNGKVSSVECIKMELGEPDASGRRRPVPIKGSEYLMDVDTVILAIGQMPEREDIPSDVSVTKGDLIIADETTLETNQKGVFASGDIVIGPSTVIDAIAAGKRAAESIERYLNGVDLKEGRDKLKVLAKDIPIDDVVPEPRQPLPEHMPESLLDNFDEIELGFTPEMASIEANRCLSCGGCSECHECEHVCDAHAIDHEITGQTLDLDVGAIILSPGATTFDPTNATKYGYGRNQNVVTSIEFERILSASGPFMGHVQRPSDSKLPKKIAFIQCVGSRDMTCDNQYCSSVCCMYATKEAVIAKEHFNDIEPTIFYMDMRSYGKDFDRYIDRARDEHGVRFVRCRVSHTEEDPETKDVKLVYTEGNELKEEMFDLVVLSVGVKPSDEVRQLSERLGVRLNEFGFCETPSLHPLETSRNGIFVSGMFSSPKDIPETVTQASAAACSAGELLAPARGTLVKTKEYPKELFVDGQPPRIGVFVCHCGTNIGGVVNVPNVVEYAMTLPNVVYADDNLYTCSSDTQEKIKEAIKEYKLNKVVVASCSPRTHEPLFQETIREAGLNRYLFEMANIRDQCSWVHMKEPIAATEKSMELLKMAVAKARGLEPLQRVKIGVTPKALVIGGGASGMNAALSLAEQGYHTYLVEKSDSLGGKLKKLYYSFEYDDLQEYLRNLTKQVMENDKISVFLDSTIQDTTGYVGNFTSTIVSNQDPSIIDEVEHGVVIVATGAEEYEPTEYLFNENPNVVTQIELEKQLATGSGGKYGTVVMIQCVGSRNDEHPYCSRICCGEAIKNATKIRETDPDSNVFILYRDIRTYGLMEKNYEKAQEAGVVFIQYDEHDQPKVWTENKQGKETLIISVNDPVLGEKITIEADRLVLSAGITHGETNEELAQMLKIPINQDGFFLEAHAKLRPVDFATEGIFFCGLAHSPKLMEESISQAKAAVSRACTILSKDELEATGVTARVKTSRCTGCGLCVMVCPYNALAINEEKGVMEVNVATCKGCGACAATCRSSAIDVMGYSDGQVYAIINTLVSD